MTEKFPPPTKGNNAILDARQRRWESRLTLASAWDAPVVTLTLNIPGNDKNPPGVQQAFKILQEDLREALVKKEPSALLHAEDGYGADGLFCHFVCKAPVLELKCLTVNIETEHFLGRLADIDVLDRHGHPISRENAGIAPRLCFLCPNLPTVCRRENRHSQEEILAFVRCLLQKATGTSRSCL